MNRLMMMCVTAGGCLLSQVAMAQDNAPPASAPPPAAAAPSSPGSMAAAPVTQTVIVQAAPYVDTRPQQSLEKPKPEPIMFRQGLFGVLGGVSDSPFFVAAVTPLDHMFLGAGLSFTYNGNGNVEGAPAPGTTDKVESNLLLAAEYMLIDHLPFSLGPEVQVVIPLAPSSITGTVIVQPGVAFWYIPWRAPLVLGSALDVAITDPKGAKASFTLVTPGLRLGYIFN